MSSTWSTCWKRIQSHGNDGIGDGEVSDDGNVCNDGGDDDVYVDAYV